MATKRDRPYIYTTWITGVLAGDAHCEWAPWFRTHFQDFDKIAKDTDLTAWKAQHGEMVRNRVEFMKRAGYSVFVENQNKFTMRGKAATLAGVPDIVAVRDDEALVIDCKTGQAKDSDVFQVLIYMLILPMTHMFCAGKRMSGELQYRSTSIAIPAEKLTDSIRALIRTTVERIAGEEPLKRVPSWYDCRFCDIGSDCDERVTVEPGAVTTDAFF